jgi:hypothetical protein
MPRLVPLERTTDLPGTPGKRPSETAAVAMCIGGWVGSRNNMTLPMTTARVEIEEIGAAKTRMSIESEFPTVEAMEQLAAMGMEEGLTQAAGQIDAILAEDPVEPGGGRR